MVGTVGEVPHLRPRTRLFTQWPDRLRHDAAASFRSPFPIAHSRL